MSHENQALKFDYIPLQPVLFYIYSQFHQHFLLLRNPVTAN